MNKSTIKNAPNPTSSGSGEGKHDLIDRQAALDALKGLPTWWADEGGYYGGAQPPMVALLDPEDAVSAIENLPSAQPATSCSEIPNSSDTISRQAALDIYDDYNVAVENGELEAYGKHRKRLLELPSAQPEIIRCKDCIYYDPPHVENNGVRYEYTEMPADAFDVLGTGLVTTEYGINIGGRCCRDYNAGYEDDKRVYVPENNHCGRGGGKENRWMM